MGDQTYKIELIKESKNYDRWSEDIQGVLALDHCWLVTIGKEITPKIPQRLPEEKPASTKADGEIIPGITITEEMKYSHGARKEKYWDKLLDCDDKYSLAFAKISLNCEDGLRVHIKGMENPNKMWRTFKRQYEASDLVTQDNNLSQRIWSAKE